MNISGRLTLAAAAFVAAVTASHGFVAAASPVIAVKLCEVTKPKIMSRNASGTQISYVIYGRKNVSSITFAVHYRNSAQPFVRTVTDVGSFAPGVTISHHFALYNDVTYGGAHASCMPLRVKYADATYWTAPTH